MKLLLTSLGIHDSYRDEFLDFLGRDPKDIKVSFVTTAAYGENKDVRWLENFRNQLRKYGINDIVDLDLKDKSENELEQILLDRNMIYVNGGNTFYLLDQVKKSGFDKVATKLVENGVLYFGVSAGSILVNPTIESAGWNPNHDANNVGIKDMSAMNLTPFLIIPHFSPSYSSLAKEDADKSGYPVIALLDSQAILVNDKSYKIIGEGERLEFK